MAIKDNMQRINTDELDIGMQVLELDRPWVESPFTVHGFKIKSPHELRALRECCKYVYIVAKPKADATGAKLQPRRKYKDKLTVQQAMPMAISAHRQARSVVKGYLKNLRLGQDFDVNGAKQAVKECVNSVIANRDAILWLTLLKNVDEYTAEHSLNVGLLSIVLGRAEGLAPSDLETVGLCGILHDMGKSEIPLDILNKEGAFSDREFEIMKSHTTKGYRILSKKADVTQAAAEVAYSHHERLNGRGYPRGLAADDISYFTRIVAIADTYDAITSKRVYSSARNAQDALAILIGAKGSHYDANLVDRFVASMGVYPAGSIAELSTKEIGIILPTAMDKQNTPRVLVVRDSNKEKCTERIIDLSEEPIDKKGKPIKVYHLLSDGIFGINLQKYHEKITKSGEL